MCLIPKIQTGMLISELAPLLGVSFVIISQLFPFLFVENESAGDVYFICPGTQLYL